MLKEPSSQVTKKILHELGVWAVLASISLGVSASIIGGSVKDILAASTTSQLLIDIGLVLFGSLWFIISFLFLINLWKIGRKHSYLVLLKMKISRIKREDIVDLVVDTISLYRGYRWYIVSLTVITLVIGLLMIGYLIYQCLVIGLSISEVVFKSTIGMIMIFYSSLSLYLSEVWMAKRLNKGQQLESELDRFLGEVRDEA